MPFNNPIVGGTQLVRSAIQSAGFQTGVSGWSINRVGTAEFNNAIIRGELDVGPASPSPRITRGPVPATLVAASTDFTWSTADVFWFNATDYYFQVIGIFNAGAIPITALGTYTVAAGVLFNSFQQNTPAGNILYSSATYNSQKLNYSYRFSNTQYFNDAGIAFDGNVQAGAIFQQTGFVQETWHAMAFLNGWANNPGTNPHGSYRKVASPANSVQLIGSFVPGTKVDGTQIASALPSAYWPITSIDIPVTCNAMAGQSPHFNVSTAGVITCYGMTAATNVGLCQIYPQDI